MWHIETSLGRSQGGRGIGRRDHFLPYEFIKRTIQCRANFTKQLLIASKDIRLPEKQPTVFERR